MLSQRYGLDGSFVECNVSSWAVSYWFPPHRPSPRFPCQSEVREIKHWAHCSVREHCGREWNHEMCFVMRFNWHLFRSYWIHVVMDMFWTRTPAESQICDQSEFASSRDSVTTIQYECFVSIRQRADKNQSNIENISDKHWFYVYHIKTRRNNRSGMWNTKILGI